MHENVLNERNSLHVVLTQGCAVTQHFQYNYFKMTFEPIIGIEIEIDTLNSQRRSMQSEQLYGKHPRLRSLI